MTTAITEDDALQAVKDLESPSLFNDLMPERPLPLDDVMGLAMSAGLLGTDMADGSNAGE